MPSGPDRSSLVCASRADEARKGVSDERGDATPPSLRCLHPRLHNDGLDQEYNSIDAQRDAGHAYIASQRAEGWIPVADDNDDPAYSGG